MFNYTAQGFPEVVLGGRLTRLHYVQLTQETHSRLNQILVEVKLIMGHIWWGKEESRALTLLLELVCVTNGYQFVQLTMENKSGARHLVHLTQIIELFSQ